MKCHAVPYEGTEKYIFFSYCQKDAGIAYPLMERLTRAGCRIWYDQGIQTGSEWPEVIGRHLEQCAVFLLLITESAIRSHNCRNEMNFAVQSHKTIIPVMYGKAKLSPGMKLMMGTTQWIQLSEIPTDTETERILTCEGIQPCRGLPDQRVEVQPFAVPAERKTEPEYDFFHLNETIRPAPAPRPAKPVNPEPAPAPRPAKPVNPEPAPAPRPAKPVNPEPAPAPKPAPVPKQADSVNPGSPPRRHRKREYDEDYSDQMTAVQTFRQSDQDEKEDDYGEETVLDSQPFRDSEDQNMTIVERKTILPVVVRIRSGERFSARNGKTMIGRGKTCDILISDPDKRIGREHAYLTVDRDFCLLTDNNSTNGTYVDGRMLGKEESVQIEGVSEIMLSSEKLLVANGIPAERIHNASFLLCLSSEDTGETQYLWEGKLELGRSHPWSGNVLQAPNISHSHATIDMTPEGAALTDHSRNGTILNDQRIAKDSPVMLSTGDRIRIGKNCFDVNLIRF